MAETKTSPKKAGKSKLPLVLAIVVALLLVVPWLLRSTIATSMARGQLAEQGLRCDDRFAVEVDATFGQAALAPTRCEHEGGLVEAIEIAEGATVTLDGFTPSTISAPQLSVRLRDRDLRGGSGWGNDTLRTLGLEQKVAGLVKGLSELSAIPFPPTEVARVEVTRADQPAGSIRRLRLSRGSELEISAGEIAFASSRLTLANVTGHATRSEVVLDGRAQVQTGILIASFTTETTFGLTATGLDGARPSFRLRAGP